MSRTALVIGGNRGIGLATARALIEGKFRVAVTYRETPPPDDIFSTRCDVRNSNDVDAAFSAVEAELGPVEIAIVNAGITRDQLLVRMDEDDFKAVIDTNLTGAYRVAKRASKNMLRAKWGRLIFISSAVAFRGERGQTNYAASKAGLPGIARSITRELGPRNITANVIAPGFIETDMTDALTEAQRAHMLEQIPAGRAGQPEEVATVACFLATDQAAYITGAVIPVDGGVAMGH